MLENGAHNMVKYEQQIVTFVTKKEYVEALGHFVQSKVI